jgi:hypothetical protein
MKIRPEDELSNTDSLKTSLPSNYLNDKSPKNADGFTSSKESISERRSTHKSSTLVNTNLGNTKSWNLL